MARRRTAFETSELDEMKQRVHPGRCNIGIGLEVSRAREIGARVSSFSPSDVHEVPKGVGPCGGDIRIGFQVPLAIEQSGISHQLERRRPSAAVGSKGQKRQAPRRPNYSVDARCATRPAGAIVRVFRNFQARHAFTREREPRCRKPRPLMAGNSSSSASSAIWQEKAEDMEFANCRFKICLLIQFCGYSRRNIQMRLVIYPAQVHLGGTSPHVKSFTFAGNLLGV